MATRVKLFQLTQDSASDGQVITWDNTLSVWKPTTISGSGTSAGVTGSVQFSDGSGGFLADGTNFFWDDTANQLKLTGGTSYGMVINGQNGGISISPTSSVTGAYNGLNISADATGTTNLLVTNTNTSSGTSNSRVAITTSTGGGDPYLKLTTAESGYVIGMDNSASDVLVIGLGTDPSNMSTTNLTFSASSLGVLQSTPTAILHVGAGTSVLAPFKLTSGTNLTTPEAGALEWNGTNLFVTQTSGPTRKTLAYTTDITTPTLSSLLAATATNSIANANFTQSWSWNTITTGTSLSLTSSSITTGALLAATSTSTSINATNGLLYVANNSTTTTGLTLKVSSNNNIANAGFVVANKGTVGIGVTNPTAAFEIGGTPDLANNSAQGMLIKVSDMSINDIDGAGTLGHVAMSAFGTITAFANSTVTYTNASTLYVKSAPVPGTNVTITNPYALYVASGKTFLGDSVSATNTVTDVLQVQINSTGTAAAGFGSGILFQAETSTTDSTNQSRISSIWTTASHASRRSALIFSTVFNGSAITELVRMDGLQVKISGQVYASRFADTDGTTIAIDWNKSNVHSVTLGGSRTITFSNPTDGAKYRIILKQDATGSRTINWPTIKWKGGSAPTLTTTGNKYDIIELIYDGTNYYGDATLNY